MNCKEKQTAAWRTAAAAEKQKGDKVGGGAREIRRFKRTNSQPLHCKNAWYMYLGTGIGGHGTRHKIEVFKYI